MRILVHEFVSGGGLAGKAVPRSLAREGSAMRAALVADLAAIGRHQVVATVEPRFPLDAPPEVERVMLGQNGRRLDDLIASTDAVWLVAPETDRCLERLASRVERQGKVLLGSGSVAVRRASDKASLPRLFARHGVAHPPTYLLPPTADWAAVARVAGYPVVVKPRRGAGCERVYFARDDRELRQIIGSLRRTRSRTSFLLQGYIAGTAASVSILTNGHAAVALSLNAQAVHVSRAFSYSGGRTPLRHPLAALAIETALRACDALPGLRGFVGVDLVLSKSEAVVIEVNPRLTTAYLGVRAAFRGRQRTERARNVAAMTLDACAGALPTPPPLVRRVRFSADGLVVSTALLSSADQRP
jgi:predicted ATP-grasp superfamily ATP-dependent carboligase